MKAIDVESIQIEMEPWEAEVISMVSKRPGEDLLLVEDRKGKQWVVRKSVLARQKKQREILLDWLGCVIGVIGMGIAVARIFQPFSAMSVLWPAISLIGFQTHQIRIWFYQILKERSHENQG